MLFGILLASLGTEKNIIRIGNQVNEAHVDAGATYLGRLADLLSDHLPLVCLVLLDCVTEFYRLRRVSWENSRGFIILSTTTKGSYLIFSKFSVVHILRKTSAPWINETRC